MHKLKQTLLGYKGKVTIVYTLLLKPHVFVISKNKNHRKKTISDVFLLLMWYSSQQHSCEKQVETFCTPL